MPKAVFFCEVNIDGSGDFEHLYTILAALKKMPALDNFEMYAVVEGGGRFVKDIKKKLSSLKLSQYFINEYTHNFDNKDLLQHVQTADQVFIISMAYGSRIRLEDIKQHVSPKALIKYIGEHEGFYDGAPDYLLVYPMGLSKGTLGLKLNKESNMLAEPLETLSEHDPIFGKKLLESSNCGSIQEYKKSHLFVPAYFQSATTFVNFLVLFITNKKLPDRDITIYLSGKLNHDINEALSSLSKCEWYKSKEHNVKIINLIRKGRVSATEHTEDSAASFSMNNPGGTRTITIMEGFRLSEEGFDAALEAASFMIGSSGDNTFEKTISKRKLPFYWSTNWCNWKIKTLVALYDIVLKKIDTLSIDEQTRNDLIRYFNPENLQSVAYNGKFREFENIDLIKLAQVWPTIAEELIANHNFYDRLYSVFTDKLDLKLLATPERQSSAADVADSLSNLWRTDPPVTSSPSPSNIKKKI